MSCDHWREMIIDRLADELGEEESVQLEQHLRDCAECADELTRLRRLTSAAAPRCEWAADPAMERRLLSETRSLRLGKAARGRRPAFAERLARFWSYRLGRPLPAYATLGLVLIAAALGFWAGHARSPGVPTASPSRTVWTTLDGFYGPDGVPLVPSESRAPAGRRTGPAQELSRPILAPSAPRDSRAVLPTYAALQADPLMQDPEGWFVTVPTDAFAIAETTSRDSL